jgi:hypothetical protein
MTALKQAQHVFLGPWGAPALLVKGMLDKSFQQPPNPGILSSVPFDSRLLYSFS